MPHVYYLANERHPRAPAVALDEPAIGRLAARHLIHRGYRHLAFFGCGARPWSQQRGAGGVRVAEVVRALRTTPVTLGKRFRQHLKLTPAQYILQRRLEYAKELLRAGELTVAEISAAGGWHDCSYFCQVFKKATGLRPGDFRPPRPAPARW